MGSVCGKGGAFYEKDGGQGIDGAEEGDAAAGLVLVEETLKLELRDQGLGMGGDFGGCC